MKLSIQQFRSLPLSQAIREALKDVTYLTNHGMKLFMESFWDAGSDGGICSVCFAGAILVNRMHRNTRSGVADNWQDGKWDWDQAAESLGIPNEGEMLRLVAAVFDDLRRGQISGAFRRWYNTENPHLDIARLNYDSYIRSWTYTLSGDQVKAFKRQMHQVANSLEKLGY